MTARKRTFYLSLRMASDPVLDTVQELIEAERDQDYREQMASLPPQQRVFLVYDPDTDQWQIVT